MARSTIWMARSTPAQNPRGLASSTFSAGRTRTFISRTSNCTVTAQRYAPACVAAGRRSRYHSGQPSYPYRRILTAVRSLFLGAPPHAPPPHRHPGLGFRLFLGSAARRLRPGQGPRPGSQGQEEERRRMGRQAGAPAPAAQRRALPVRQSALRRLALRRAEGRQGDGDRGRLHRRIRGSDLGLRL